MQFSHLSLWPWWLRPKLLGRKVLVSLLITRQNYAATSPAVSLRYLLGSWGRQSRPLPQLLSSHLHETCLYQAATWMKGRTGCGEKRKNEKASQANTKSCWTTNDITLSLVLNLDVALDFLIPPAALSFSPILSHCILLLWDCFPLCILINGSHSHSLFHWSHKPALWCDRMDRLAYSLFPCNLHLINRTVGLDSSFYHADCREL